MRTPLPSRRFAALLQIVLLAVPLAALGHYHAPGHDGGTPHFETDHGGHVVAAPELAEAIASTPSGLSPAVLSQPVASIPSAAVVADMGLQGALVSPPGRSPPGPKSARGPPVRP